MAKLIPKNKKKLIVTGERGENRAPITTVKQRNDTTYQVPPISLRLSRNDKKEVMDWVDDVSELTALNRKVSPAKLMRALLLMREDIDDAKLAAHIDKMA
ncbi:hypothetical protein [Vibrio sp. WXL210]|uniref:hypothetical protein n=1 Tax=Vibrio sp. WXL210 TaxID=3450709 RepID=UPI003EC80648